MLKRLNITYLILSTLFLVLFLPQVKKDYLLIYIFNSFSSLTYFAIINYQVSKNTSYFSSKNLINIILIYSVVFVIINNAISYAYKGNFFVFSEMDAAFYDQESLKMAFMEFNEGIRYFLLRNSTEDLGAVLIISSLYRIIESNLIVNLFYILTGLITATCIFRISKVFMSLKYAYLCALSYSISSYVIWYHSSGLKESFMIMLIVIFFDQFYQFYTFRKYRALLIGMIPLLLLFFFRPIVISFCISSVAFGILFSRKINTYSVIIFILVTIATIYLSQYFETISRQYIYGSSDELIEMKEKSNMIKGSLVFTYITNIVSATIGPLPTYITSEKIVLSFFSSGLLYRMLISVFLWFGIFYVIKSKTTLIYPLVLFFLLEAVSLTYILEALELRKSLPHFPMIFIISFWFISQFHSKSTNSISKNNRLKIKIFVTYFSIICFFLIIYWNFR